MPGSGAPPSGLQVGRAVTCNVSALPGLTAGWDTV